MENVYQEDQTGIGVGFLRSICGFSLLKFRKFGVFDIGYNNNGDVIWGLSVEYGWVGHVIGLVWWGDVSLYID